MCMKFRINCDTIRETSAHYDFNAHVKINELLDDGWIGHEELVCQLPMPLWYVQSINFCLTISLFDEEFNCSHRGRICLEL